jgi:hypothetical protein
MELGGVQARDAIRVVRYAEEIDFQSNLFSEKHPKEIAFRTTEGILESKAFGERDLAKNTHTRTPVEGGRF